jgi:hypothetical protein
METGISFHQGINHRPVSGGYQYILQPYTRSWNELKFIENQGKVVDHRRDKRGPKSKARMKRVVIFILKGNTSFEVFYFLVIKM